MTKQERYNALLKQERELKEQFKNLVVEFLKEHGAIGEENAYCYEDDTPYLNVDGKYDPMEVQVTAIWLEDNDTVMATLTPTGFGDEWNQDLSELPVDGVYANLLWFIDLEE